MFQHRCLSSSTLNFCTAKRKNFCYAMLSRRLLSFTLPLKHDYDFIIFDMMVNHAIFRVFLKYLLRYNTMMMLLTNQRTPMTNSTTWWRVDVTE